MATSGSFNTGGYTVSDGSRCLTFSWERKSYSIEKNQTTISWELRGGGTSKQWVSTRNIKLVIDGETVYQISGNGTTFNLDQGDLITSGSYTFTHENDGSRRFTVYAEAGIYVWAVNCTGSKTFALDTLPRASTIDALSCATKYFTGQLTYKYTPKSSAYYNRCNISLNLDGEYIAVKSINLGKKSAAQQTGTVTLSANELATIYNRLPTRTSGVLRFTLRTYSDSGYSNQVGDAGYKEITLNIPNDSTTQADLTMVLSPVDSLPANFDRIYIQGKSKVKASLTAAGKYNAAVNSGFSMKVEGKTYNAKQGPVSDFLSQSGSLTVYGYVTDSRGFTASTSKKITVIPYSKPKILNVEADRCDVDGNISDSGTYLRIKAKRSYSPVKSEGVQKNFCKIRYRYKLESASSYSSWVTILAANSLDSDEVTTGALLDGALSIEHTYLVQVQAIDDIGDYATTTTTVSTDGVYMHRTKNAMGLGKYVEREKTLDVAWDAIFRGDVFIGDTGMTLKEYILAVISEGG